MDINLLSQMTLLSLSSLLGGMTVVISIRYYFAWRKRTHHWRGLLPLHVFTVTLSYNLMLIYSTIEMMIRINDDSHEASIWPGLLLAPAYIFGFVAMHAVAKLRRKHRLNIDG